MEEKTRVSSPVTIARETLARGTLMTKSAADTEVRPLRRSRGPRGPQRIGFTFAQPFQRLPGAVHDGASNDAQIARFILWVL